MESKKDIRIHVLSRRSKLSKKEWEEKSHLIYKKVAAHPFFLNSDEIYCYIDFRNEVGTKELIESAWKLQKKVAVPKIIGNQMEFMYIDSYNELEPGTFGILEPKTDKKANGNNVLVIMPGAVFDCKRSRIGYGKGYYDQYLSLNPDYKTIALAFELQVLEEIPTQLHDIKPKAIITEEEIYV